MTKTYCLSSSKNESKVQDYKIDNNDENIDDQKEIKEISAIQPLEHDSRLSSFDIADKQYLPKGLQLKPCIE